MSTVAIVIHSYRSLILSIATLLSLARYLGLENRVVDDEGREEGRGEQGKGGIRTCSDQLLVLHIRCEYSRDLVHPIYNELLRVSSKK